MGRRKGEITSASKDRTHPWQVEVPSDPDRVLVSDAMYRWASAYSHETKGGQRSYTWCFCSEQVADEFADIFGGVRIDKPVLKGVVALDELNEQELERRRRASRFGMELIEEARGPLPEYLQAVLDRIEAKRRARGNS